MANYNLVADSNFQPYTFEQYILPYAIYDKAYREVEDGITNLLSLAEMMQELALQSLDKDTYNIIQNHVDDLRNLAESLANNGLTPNNRAALNRLKVELNRIISPIKLKFERRQLLIDEQRKLGPDYFYDVDYSQMPISQMDLTATYKPFSRTKIAKDSSVIFSSLANYIENDKSLQLKINTGASPEEVLATIAGTLEGNEILLKMLLLARLSSGAFDVDKDGNYKYSLATRDAADSSINEAMFTSIGRAYDNRDYMTEAQRRQLAISEAANRREEAEFQTKYEKDEKTGEYRIRKDYLEYLSKKDEGKDELYGKPHLDILVPIKNEKGEIIKDNDGKVVTLSIPLIVKSKTKTIPNSPKLNPSDFWSSGSLIHDRPKTITIEDFEVMYPDGRIVDAETKKLAVKEYKKRNGIDDDDSNGSKDRKDKNHTGLRTSSNDK